MQTILKPSTENNIVKYLLKYFANPNNVCIFAFGKSSIILLLILIKLLQLCLNKQTMEVNFHFL